MAYGAGPNNSGPNKRLNGPDGRQRNTQTSNNTKNGSNVPGVPRGGGGVPQVPGFGASYGSVPGAAGALAGAWASLQNIMAAEAAKRKGYKAAFKSERANIRSEAIGAMSEAINAGIESGMTGSSSVSQARIGVLGDRRAAIEEANTAMKAQILESKAAVQREYMGFQITQAQMEAQAEAARQQAALQAQAIAAQRESSAAMVAALNAQQGGELSLRPGATFMGRQVTMTPNGNFQVAGLTFRPGTPTSQIRAAIENQLRQNIRAETFVPGPVR